MKVRLKVAAPGVARLTELSAPFFVSQWAQSQLAELKSHLESLLEDRRSSLQASIDALNDRVSRLEAQFADDKADTLREVNARNKELTDKLEDFQVSGEHWKEGGFVLPWSTAFCVRHTPTAPPFLMPTSVLYRRVSLQAAFEAERKDRMEREGRIQSNLSKHEHETFERFEAERVGVHLEGRFG